MQKEQVQKIRGLIADLRLCHHKAQRHVELIVQAIGEEQTAKGYPRPRGGEAAPGDVDVGERGAGSRGLALREHGPGGEAERRPAPEL